MTLKISKILKANRNSTSVIIRVYQNNMKNVNETGKYN
uniref:Bm14132 n=1 Tax=Brugia malayi TaxID=6279 RepID=A0A1I9G7X9_BRUMA|nr:Bm14132 [Brugia malayi]